ncbi:MAG: hypothetical protein HAW62_03455 [Endozoicomonadaceae bacterium]|nr:hypothetical protein [Endozoicomonadaceae bacterium]
MAYQNLTEKTRSQINILLLQYDSINATVKEFKKYPIRISRDSLHRTKRRKYCDK